MEKSTKAKIYAGITILLWATVFIFTKAGLRYYDAETLAVIRYILASAGLIVLIFIKKMKKPDLKDIPLFLILGFLGFAFYIITFNRGMVTLNSSTSSVILACSPIIASVLSGIFLKEKVSIFGWMSIIISFLGITVLTLWEGVFKFNTGIFWILLSAVLVATYNVSIRKVTEKYTGMEAAVYSMLAGTLLLIIYLPASILKIGSMSSISFFIVIWLAIPGTVIAYIFWSMALEAADTTGEVTNFMFITPFLATLMGIIFLGEKLTVATVTGGILILSGVIGYSKYK